MEEKIQDLQEKLLGLDREMNAVIATADAEKRDLSQDELDRLSSFELEVKRTQRDIEAREKLLRQKDDLAKPSGRKTEPAPVGDQGADRADPAPRRASPSGLSGGHAPRLPAEVKDGRLGFRTFGEFALSVHRASHDGGVLDRRLEQLAPSNFGNESSGADGGFAIPPDYRNQIMQKVMGEESLVSRTDQMTTSSNSMTVPVDETEPWSTSGIRAYWEGEGAQKRNSRPNLSNTTFKLNKLAALVIVTDELLEDATALDSYIRRRAPQAIDWKVNESIVFGTGAGQPQGIVNSPSKIKVSKESGQTADTIVFKNVQKMWARMYAPCRRRAVWLVNQDVESQLEDMYAATGSNSGQLLFMPPGGVSGAPYATLRGRPIIPMENCPPVGDEGDIILVDLSQYLTLTKNERLRQDVSIHLYFDYDMTAFRFVMRFGGQSWWKAPIARAKGGSTLSNIVTLEDRA